MRLSALVETSHSGLSWVDTTRSGVTPSRDVEVRDVVTTDLLDPARYLSGGELVLTGMAWWRENEPARTRGFVQALTRAGVAALAVGEAQLGAVPDDIVASCAEAGLPLLRVPVAVSFSAIIESAALHLSSARRSGELAAVLGRHRALVSAAVGRVGDGSGLTGVLDLVAADQGPRCWVLSVTGRLVAGPAAGLDARDRQLFARRFARAARLPCRVRRPAGRTYSLVGAGAVRTDSWMLVVDEDHDDWGPVRRGVVDELVALVAVERELTTRRSSAEVEFVSVVGRGAAADLIRAAAARCGVNLAMPSVVVTASGAHAGALIAEALADDSCAIGEVDGEVVVVLTTEQSPDVVVARLRTIVELVAPALGDPPVVIGVSGAVMGAAGLVGAVGEARAVAHAAAARRPPIPRGTSPTSVATSVATNVATSVATNQAGRHVVAGPDQLSTHALLLAAVPAEVRRAYRARVLGPLTEHDRRHRTDLVRTLSAYLACSGSWSQCAAQLHVHVNTLRYRMERIAALTGRDLRRLDDQMDLLLALRLPEEGA